MVILRASSNSFFGMTFGNIGRPVHAKVGLLDGLACGLSSMAPIAGVLHRVALSFNSQTHALASGQRAYARAPQKNLRTGP